MPKIGFKWWLLYLYILSTRVFGYRKVGKRVQKKLQKMYLLLKDTGALGFGYFQKIAIALSRKMLRTCFMTRMFLRFKKDCTFVLDPHGAKAVASWLWTTYVYFFVCFWCEYPLKMHDDFRRTFFTPGAFQFIQKHYLMTYLECHCRA